MSLKTNQLPSACLSWKDWVKLMGFSWPSTCVVLSIRRGVGAVSAYLQRSGNKDQDAVIGRGLGVNGVGTVHHLLEGQVLRQSATVFPRHECSVY